MDILILTVLTYLYSVTYIGMYESLDIETIWDDGIAKPICIAITSNDKIYFKKIHVSEVDSDIILNFLLKKCSGKKIYYVHNLTFEAFVFLRSIIKNKIKFKIISSNRVVYSMEIYYKKKKIRMRCSYRLTMLSLKNLARIACVKQKGVFPYKILDRSMPDKILISKDMFDNDYDYNSFTSEYGFKINTYDILEEYCKNDVDITKKSIIEYWKIIEEGGLKNNNKILTAAKLSVENYFKSNKIIKRKIKIKYDRILRPWYFGGRTEVFGNPREDEILLHYDWSGMYAQCMSEKVLGGEIIESNIIKDVYQPGFYWIKFRQKLDIPILPIRRKKLLFVNGTFEGWYWFEEILLAIEYGVEIISIDKMIGAQYYDSFIKDFVNINNKIREKSELHKQIGKNNNNSFYGRLGMNPDRLEEEILTKIENPKIYEKITEVNGVFIGYKKSEKTISNILISSSITSKARIKLYRGMMEVIKNGGRMIYTDTDSIIAAFNKNSYEKILNKQIGEVLFDSNKKDTIIEEGVFAMPKTYALKFNDGNEIVKIKGFSVRPDFNEFKNKFYNKEWVKTKNTEWNKKDFMIRTITKEKKTYLFGLDKRIWSEDLKNTFPFDL